MYSTRYFVLACCESSLASLPRDLPAYVMAGVNSLSNTQLARRRRRIDYQEAAEYRVVESVGAALIPTTPNTTTVAGVTGNV
ncbi:unnamed protein product [Mesocestoides corti]|uniref:Secreted protein n=1 Tax=Mesocestoides corti TaxID=53468 RepID=A0A0R3UDF3_MESCO|nr:unnamed protein product [Mesocestoides corti]